jgi:hypothetical protein
MTTLYIYVNLLNAFVLDIPSLTKRGNNFFLFEKGLPIISPFEKGGLRGIF